MGNKRKRTTKEVSASSRLLDDSSDGSIDNPVPWDDVPAPALAPPHTLAPAIKFLTDVKAVGIHMYRQVLVWLRDYTEHGLHPGLITRAEELFEGHPDLLVVFNSYLPEDFQCTVPE